MHTQESSKNLEKSLNNSVTPTSLKIHQVAGSHVVLILSKKLQNQIKYLCQKIDKVEWSGTLFYRIESGSFKENNCVLVGEELYLQDIGTEAYTEYEYGEDFITLMMNNPMLQDCKMAHVH